MLLNPDTQLINDALYKMFNFLEGKDNVAAVGPQLVTKSEMVQYSCRTFPGYRDLFFELSLLSTFFPSSKIFSRWKMKYFDHDELREVEQPMAAALLIKREVLNKTGNLDERFYMFFNDIDICKQIHNLGYKIYFYPEAKIYHNIGTSILKDRSRMIRIWNKDCLKYFKKYKYNFILYTVLSLGLLISGELRILFTKIFYRK